MSARAIALVVAACGWLIAGLIAYALFATVGFALISVIGLVLWVVSGRIDLEKDAPAGGGWSADLVARQHQARERLSAEERASRHHELSLTMEAVRLLKQTGMALTLIGAACLFWFELLH